MFEHFDTPEEVFDFRLGAALKMEEKLVGILGELEEKANRQEIKGALHQHQDETRKHVANLRQAFTLLGQDPDDSPNPVIDALEKEGTSALRKSDASLADAVVLCGAVEAEHYEIAVYETLIPNAKARGAHDVAALLEQNLAQEQHALDVARNAMEKIAQEGIAPQTV